MSFVQKIAILIIEDNPIDQVVLGENIKRSKLSVSDILIASTLQDAIAILCHQEISIIFLDLFLPDSIGLASFEHISLHCPTVPIIICSSQSDSEVTLKAISLGAQDFLIKGHYDYELLEKTILYSIERKKNLEIIKESNDRYNAIFNGTNDAILLTNDEGKIIQANPGAIKMTGFSQQELLFRSINEIIIARKSKKNVFAEDEIKYGTSQQSSIIELKTNQEKILSCIYHSEKNILPGLHLTILTDITKHKNAEDALQDSFTQIQVLADRQTAIINSLPFHIIVLNEQAEIVEVNQSATEYASINPLILSNVFIGKNYIDIAKKAGSEGVTAAKKLALAISSINTGNEKELSLEYSCIAGEDRIWFRVNITRLNEQGKGGVVISHANITERKRSEQLIRESNEQLRLLASHLQNIREDERTNIAREIHDELGQQLTGLKMDMAWINKKLQSPDNIIKEKITGLLETIDTAISTVRRISSELRPGIIDDFGLQAAMEWQAGEFTKRTGVACFFKASYTEDVPDKMITIALFRIFQESLTNVARHAMAKRVYAQLRKEDDNIILSINDDGVGMDMALAKSKRTLGLMGMKERSIMVNGSCNIISEPGGGTTITVVVPYPSHN